MEYITQVLGIKVQRQPWDIPPQLPFYLRNNYRVEVVFLDHTACLFISPVAALPRIVNLKKHVETFKITTGYPVVVETEYLSAFRISSLIESRIPFVIPGSQLYLPFVGVLLQNTHKEHIEKPLPAHSLLPSAQLILFHFILQGNKPLYLRNIENSLHYTSMSVSRATGQLASLGLVSKENEGLHKKITSNLLPKDLYTKALPHIINPVRKTLYIRKSQISSEFFPSGLTALSQMSMLNQPELETWGTIVPEKELTSADTYLKDSDVQCQLQLWKYDPRLISSGNEPDILSMASSLADEKDERVESELHDLLSEVW